MNDPESPEPIEPVWVWIGLAATLIALSGFLVLVFLIARGTRSIWSA